MRGEYRRVLASDDAGNVQYAVIRHGEPTPPQSEQSWIKLKSFARWAKHDLQWSACCNVAYRIEGKTTLYCVCPKCDQTCDP